MTTAELLKKREEEKNNPQISATPPSISAPKPAVGMNMAEARMAGNSDMPSEPVKQPGTPLYDAGVSFGQIAKEAAVKNPITTPEYENFRNEVIGAKQFGVETPEQAEARERRDFIKQGLTGFTEGLSALANLYYTTKWAPNQKQVSQMPVLQQQLYRERLERDKKLENFRAWQRAKADKEERAKAVKEQRDYDEKVRRENRVYQDKKDKQNQANWQAQFDWNVKQAEQNAADKAEEKAYRRKQDELNNAFRWAQLNWQKEKAKENSSGSKSSSTGSGKSKMAVIDTPNGVMDVDFGRINQRTYDQLYVKVSDEIKKKYAVDALDDDKERQEKMGQAISEALMSQKGYADWLVKAGVGVYQQQQQQPTNWGDYKYTPTDWNSYKTNQSNTQAANESPKYQPSNVQAIRDSKNIGEVTQKTEQQPSPNGNKYERMAQKYKQKYADEEAARKKTIEKAMARTAKTIEDAKSKRSELVGILNNDYPEVDIENLISENNLGFFDAASVRREYSNDVKERAKIMREIERLNIIINNR